jgi:hypothetical protein
MSKYQELSNTIQIMALVPEVKAQTDIKEFKIERKSINFNFNIK